MERLYSVHHTDRENMWLSQRHHVTQALLFVLKTANDTLATVPLASLVLNGATRAIKTFEVLYPPFVHGHELVLITLSQTVWKNEEVAISVAQQLRQVYFVILEHYQDVQERLRSAHGDPLRRGIQAFAW
jgi:hypothetical protein